jgi:ATPase family associated with various cellular activities (AAA)
MELSDAWRDAYAAGLDALHTGSMPEAVAHFTAAIEAGADVWEVFYGRAWANLTLREDGDDFANEPTFADLGGLGESGSFGARVQMIFDSYFAGDKGDIVRARLEEFGQPLTRAVLLFGPSGCGKTFLIRSFSGEYRRRHGRALPVFRLRLNDVLDRYIGESEKRVTELFDQAMDEQPSIIFGDEIDSIGMSREDGQDWRVQFTSHFLQEIDRVKESGSAVVFFGCTNRIWSIDHAMTRRFDDLIPVELPNERARAEIFTVHLRRFEGVEYDVEALAKASSGLTPGDIQKIVSSAASEALLLPSGESLTQERVVHALNAYRQPMHVRERVRQSLTALRAIGQEEMAVDDERMYGAYIGNLAAPRPDGGRRWDPIPATAWQEQPVFDLGLLRRMRS